MDTDISIVSFISAVEQHRKTFRQVKKNKLKNVCRATHLTGASELKLLETARVCEEVRGHPSKYPRIG